MPGSRTCCFRPDMDASHVNLVDQRFSVEIFELFGGSSGGVRSDSEPSSRSPITWQAHWSQSHILAFSYTLAIYAGAATELLLSIGG